jgi:NAD(P)-dependent dehydrogenase (short-subunit alcohol dehydrogenase family)
VNRVVVITGASDGIGAALARHLGSGGDRIVLAARRDALLRVVAGGIAAPTLVVPTDVTVRADVERLRDRAIAEFGGVDVWVNNAGRGLTRHVIDLTDDDIDTMIAINVKSAIYGMQAIIPHFIERGRGHLVNISSYLSRVPVVSSRSAYSAAKAMLNVLTANLRADLAAVPGIDVTLVYPGQVATSFRANALGGSPPRSAVASALAPPQSAEQVAAIIAGAIDGPAPEVYTDESLHELTVRYAQDAHMPTS